MRPRVVLASNNAGKLRELAALLDGLGLDLCTMGSLGISEPDEPWGTFLENALAKARHCARASGLPAIADDSGLCVRALHGAPGVRSARFAALAGQGQGDAANNAWLMESLRRAGASSADARAAHFTAVVVMLRHADDPEPIVCEGRWSGQILEAPRGANGFGYDPLFHVPDLGLSAAEMPAALKNRHSHRARAMALLRERLAAEFAGS